ncbi:MAG: terminase [Gordonia sp. (in: high G+C Gram-positive bacteria)]|uniref:terminase n=1 Tax=Gordonia sp. (in: high G+C Gram-positive bacteria) TaxID=84139 RepID=UPI0039E4F481
MAEGYLVDFPTLADLQDPWIQAHCCVPDGFDVGQPFVMSDWQFWCTANHYRVRASAKWQPRRPMKSQAFTHRMSLVIGPQKSGKGPWSAALTAVEAVGPSLFAGWAGDDDGYACADWGCGCGFEHEYEPGEPMGMPHPTPLIQLTATSEDQVGNVYRPLTTMIRRGPLSDIMLVREGFIRLPGDDNRIDIVTASANSRLGNPISFALHDEAGLYTKENKLLKVARTQRRGAAGMDGRTLATSNAYDASANSYAQQEYEKSARDVFKFWRLPPAGLSWGNRKERRQILKYVYAESPWVTLAAIEAEVDDLMKTDPAEAERFFGNRATTGMGSWLEDGLWEAAYAGA